MIVARRGLSAVAAVALVALVLSGCDVRGATGAQPSPPGQNVGTALDQPTPPNIAAINFTTSAGQTLSLATLRGKIIVVSDMMTLCQETCPLDTASIVQTAKTVDATPAGKNIVFLSITIDPTRDTVAQIAAYRRLYAPNLPNWYVLTGRPSDLAALWEYLGVYIQKVPDTPATDAPKNWRTGQPLTYDVIHSDAVFFFDGHGDERFVLLGQPYITKGDIPAKLYQFMDAEGYRNLDHPPQTAWTPAQARQVLAWLGKLKD